MKISKERKFFFIWQEIFFPSFSWLNFMLLCSRVYYDAGREADMKVENVEENEEIDSWKNKTRMLWKKMKIRWEVKNDEKGLKFKENLFFVWVSNSVMRWWSCDKWIKSIKIKNWNVWSLAPGNNPTWKLISLLSYGGNKLGIILVELFPCGVKIVDSMSCGVILW